ncbi:MAG TPA: PAS domain S-box protein [Syntrophales bacterium]|nr:PAS domain S-box protein [Syntrophales bacterium]HPQ43773.1 PAS domain S-box protein [Syntrophales bacterium]
MSQTRDTDSDSQLSLFTIQDCQDVENNNGPEPTEKTLQDTEYIRQSFFDAVQESIVLIDSDGNILLLNTTAAERLGKSVGELKGTYIYDYFPLTIKELRQKQVDMVFSTGKPGSFNDSRSERFFEHRLYPVFCNDKTVSSVAVFTQDITEHKRMMDELRRGEKRYRKFFATSRDCMFIASKREGWIDFNDVALKMLNYDSREDLLETPLSCLYVTPEERSSLLSLIEQNGYVGEYPLQLRRKDGVIIDTLVTAEMTHSEHDSGVEYYGTIHDITEQKKVEKARRIAESNYLSIFQNAVEGIFQSTLEGRYLTANPAMARIYGYDSPAELMETITDIESQIFVKPGDRKTLLRRMAEDGTVSGFETKHRRKDGSIIWVNLYSRIVRDNAGTILFVEGMVADITDRRKAQVACKENVLKLQQALDATIHAILATVEAKDPYTTGHQRRVADLARAIATEMGLSQDQIDGIYMAAIVHDIGKISIPSEILSKPSNLVDVELDLIKTHVQSGYTILKNIVFPQPVARMVLEHHERINGSGYPNGLMGDNLLIESRILAVADVVEAMVSYRPYRSALGIEAALEEIEKFSGILYDSDVVSVCLRIFKQKQFTLS